MLHLVKRRLTGAGGVNNKGYCKGCFRSRDERFNWLKFSSVQKREVIRLCQDRQRRVLTAVRKQQLELALSHEDSPPQDSLPL